jgi:hypothetical protein
MPRHPSISEMSALLDMLWKQARTASADSSQPSRPAGPAGSSCCEPDAAGGCSGRPACSGAASTDINLTKASLVPLLHSLCAQGDPGLRSEEVKTTVLSVRASAYCC